MSTKYAKCFYPEFLNPMFGHAELHQKTLGVFSHSTLHHYYRIKCDQPDKEEQGHNTVMQLHVCKGGLRQLLHSASAKCMFNVTAYHQPSKDTILRILR